MWESCVQLSLGFQLGHKLGITGLIYLTSFPPHYSNGIGNDFIGIECVFYQMIESMV